VRRSSNITESGEAKLSIRKLTDFLDCTSWKDCGKFAYDEVSFVAIWPWGAVEDHEAPGYIKNKMLSNRKDYRKEGKVCGSVLLYCLEVVVVLIYS